MTGSILVALSTAAALSAGAPFTRWLRLPELLVVAQAVAPATKETPSKPAAKGADAGRAEAEERPAGEAAALVDKVQRFYEKTRDFRADFTQVYRYVSMGRTQKSAGTVEVKKPGLMRWDYVKPHPKQFVLDGRDLYLYEPEDRAVMVKRGFSSDSLSAAVTFLFGQGRLADEFRAERVVRPEYGAVVLALEPRKPQPGFSKVFFAIDEATGQVLTSIVIDAQGNENRIAFANVRTNTGLEAKRFAFEVPKGTAVQEWK